MRIRSRSEALVLRENSEWLRYVFWGAAIGMSVLMVNTVNAPVRDVWKIIGIAAGILLTGFSGFVLQTRTIVIDPLRREVVLTSKGLRQKTTERLGFDEITDFRPVLAYGRWLPLAAAGQAPAHVWAHVWAHQPRCPCVPIRHTLCYAHHQ